MEASVRIFNSSNRHFCNSMLLKSHPHYSPFLFPPTLPTFLTTPSKPNPAFTIAHSSFPHSSISKTLCSILQSLSYSLTSSNLVTSTYPFARITSLSLADNKPFHWNLASHGVNGQDRGIVENNKEPITTVVLLGWLGSRFETQTFEQVPELYNSRGVPAITFVAPVKDLLSVEFGRRFQRWISALAFELASWLSEREKDGRERVLLFQLWYAILDDLQGRRDLLERIKGCVFDSGVDRNINHKVWAAGFVAALMKKCSSTTYPSVDAGEDHVLENGMTMSKMGQKEPLRLTKIISGVSKNQPPCPQLYLYSTADKVIPY